ncbi:MAG: biopolymer transporter ExbD [Prevotellaceae bacterium]|jgi:putative membrane protein|nr:biopolymer transporter ExbD [Prevotellaceae bacterium]MBF1079659.1 biopolymer transporter ExbD [Prevotellaceae bacterium]
MSMFNRRRYEVPGLNTASLPDLIFSVLFFFMIVTHMQKVAVKVQFRTPQGTELTRLTKKTAVTYIYIGKPEGNLQKTLGTATRIQLNDKFGNLDDVVDYISAERERMSPEDQQQMTVSVKADRTTKMSIIDNVKQALRKAKAYRISYSATDKNHK